MIVYDQGYDTVVLCGGHSSPMDGFHGGFVIWGGVLGGYCVDFVVLFWGFSSRGWLHIFGLAIVFLLVKSCNGCKTLVRWCI